MKHSIQTFGGRYFDLMFPEEQTYDIYDIAHALSNICRFTGHTSSFYSVAQHSVLVSMLVPDRLALKALLHDAAEAYLGDVAAPLKALLPAYRAIECRVEAALLASFNLDPTPDPIIKHADQRALVTEARDLMGRPITLYSAEPTEYRITPLRPHEAEMVFLDRFHELTQAKRMPRDIGFAAGSAP